MVPPRKGTHYSANILLVKLRHMALSNYKVMTDTP